jgi:SAM-dependent methyltransferase
MDYRDLEAGAKRDFFWFKAKLELIDVVLAKLRSEKELKILSVGCGTGEEIKVLRNYGKVYAVDIEAKALALVPDELCEEKRLADVCSFLYLPSLRSGSCSAAMTGLSNTSGGTIKRF